MPLYRGDRAGGKGWDGRRAGAGGGGWGGGSWWWRGGGGQATLAQKSNQKINFSLTLSQSLSVSLSLAATLRREVLIYTEVLYIINATLSLVEASSLRFDLSHFLHAVLLLPPPTPLQTVTIVCVSCPPTVQSTKGTRPLPSYTKERGGEGSETDLRTLLFMISRLRTILGTFSSDKSTSVYSLGGCKLGY